MQLEKIIERLEQVKWFGEQAQKSLSYWASAVPYLTDIDKYQRKHLKNRLHITRLYHLEFYDFLDQLLDLAEFDCPDPRNYEEQAISFSKKRKFTASITTTCFGLGAVGLIMDTPPIPSLSFLAAGVGAFLTFYFKYQQDKSEKKGQWHQKDLAAYVDSSKLLEKQSLAAFEKSLDSYLSGLKKVTDCLQQYLKSDRVAYLTENCLEVQNFKNYFREMIQTLQKEKTSYLDGSFNPK